MYDVIFSHSVYNNVSVIKFSIDYFIIDSFCR